MKASPKNKKTTKQKLTSRNIAVILICVIVPVIIGIYSGDLIIGGTLLATGLLSSYFAGLQKRIGFLFGLINALLVAYISLKNNLYGSFFIYAFVFAPLEIIGFIDWTRNLDKKDNVKIRKFTLKKSILIIGLCLFGSLSIGYLLTKIPNQQMAFLDSTVCCLDICASIMINLRYKEAWYIWILSGFFAIAIWTSVLLEGGDNAFMRLLMVIGYMIIDTCGVIKWCKKLK